MSKLLGITWSRKRILVFLTKIGIEVVRGIHGKRNFKIDSIISTENKRSENAGYYSRTQTHSMLT